MTGEKEELLWGPRGLKYAIPDRRLRGFNSVSHLTIFAPSAPSKASSRVIFA